MGWHSAVAVPLSWAAGEGCVFLPDTDNGYYQSKLQESTVYRCGGKVA
jgi:hypothetical protein